MWPLSQAEVLEAARRGVSAEQVSTDLQALSLKRSSYSTGGQTGQLDGITCYMVQATGLIAPPSIRHLVAFPDLDCFIDLKQVFLRLADQVRRRPSNSWETVKRPEAEIKHRLLQEHLRKQPDVVVMMTAHWAAVKAQKDDHAARCRQLDAQAETSLFAPVPEKPPCPDPPASPLDVPVEELEAMCQDKDVLAKIQVVANWVRLANPFLLWCLRHDMIQGMMRQVPSDLDDFYLKGADRQHFAGHILHGVATAWRDALEQGDIGPGAMPKAQP